MAVNALAPMAVLRSASAHVSSGGLLAAVTGTVARSAPAGMADYAAAKAALATWLTAARRGGPPAPRRFRVRRTRGDRHRSGPATGHHGGGGCRRYRGGHAYERARRGTRCGTGRVEAGHVVTGGTSQGSEHVEDVTPLSPRPLTRVLFRQWWRELVFLHWAADPDEVARLLPPGTSPDLHLGRTYVGLVFFRMDHLALGRGPALPYLGSFGEVNVRLYSRDALGRRGVVFRSLDCDRLLPVLTARTAFGLPYRWARIRTRRTGAGISYDSVRRDGSGAGARVRAEVSPEPYEANALEEFLTCRWGLHAQLRGRTYYLPNTHPRWTFSRCELTSYDETAIAAAGLRAPREDPVSVLHAPGVPVRFGPPQRLS